MTPGGWKQPPITSGVAMNIPKFSLGSVMSIIVGGAVGFYAMYQASLAADDITKPYRDSDKAPWAGIERVNNIEMALKQAIVNGYNSLAIDDLARRIFMDRIAHCAAIRRGDMSLANILLINIDTMREKYLVLRGLPYDLRPCSEFL